MDRLWAPWRIGYVSSSNKSENCFLCEAAQTPDKDAETFVVARGKHCFAILNRFPYNNGHVMIAPYAHKPDLPDLTAAERDEMMEMLLKLEDALKAGLKPHGFNVGINIGAAAGAGVPGHIHFHVVPRWTGDTNFVTTVGDLKIISQSLEESYKTIVGNLPK